MKRRTDKNTFRRAQSISRLATADESRNSSNSSPRVRYERDFFPGIYPTSMSRRFWVRSGRPGQEHLKAELPSCLEKNALLGRYQAHTLGRSCDRTRKDGRPWLRTSLAARLGHRSARGEKKRRPRWARCVVIEPPHLRDTPARGRPASTRHPPLVAFPLCYAPAMSVFAARESRSRSISLGIAESDADPTPHRSHRTQLEPRLPQELRWIGAMCSSAYFKPCERHEPAGGKEKEKAELTNFFARDTGETLCPSCVGGRDVVQVRLGFRRDSDEDH